MPKVGLPSPIFVTSIFPDPEDAFIFKAERAAFPPITPPKSTAPAPDTISSCLVWEVTESRVPSMRTLPTVAELFDEAPVWRVTVPVPISKGSEIVIVPPAPAAPEPPPVAPPSVSIFVSCKVILVAAVSMVTAPPAPPVLLVPLALLPLAVISAPVLIVTVPVLVVWRITSPASLPLPAEAAVPPEVVIDPPIATFPEVLPEPGFLTVALILTYPPSALSLPVVLIVVDWFEVNEPA